MTPLDVADWRRRVFSLYEQVRAHSEPAAAHALWCDGRNELFEHHAASALMDADRPSFTGLPVALYDPAWRFELEVESAEPGDFVYETGTDGTVGFERIGLVRVPAVGSLDVWRLTSYGGGLFVPIKDALKGKHGGTYGGGRYLLDTIKGADLGGDQRRLVVDLNYAYHPSCTYDPRWSCPLAPEGNRIEAVVAAGEQLPPGGWY